MRKDFFDPTYLGFWLRLALIPAVVFVIMAEGFVPTLFVLFFGGVILGTVWLYDSYRKEQKMFEPSKQPGYDEDGDSPGKPEDRPGA